MKSTSRGEGGGSVHTTVDTIHTVPSLRLLYLASRDIETCAASVFWFVEPASSRAEAEQASSPTEIRRICTYPPARYYSCIQFFNHYLLLMILL